MAQRSSSLWADHFSKTSGDIVDGKMFSYETKSGVTCKPVFMSVDLETPLGFSCFLANSANQRKVFIPSTFNMSKILKSVHTQESADLVCDESFFKVELPGPLASEYKEKCKNVQNVIVGGRDSSMQSSVFVGIRPTVIDPLTM